MIRPAPPQAPAAPAVQRVNDTWYATAADVPAAPLAAGGQPVYALWLALRDDQRLMVHLGAASAGTLYRALASQLGATHATVAAEGAWLAPETLHTRREALGVSQHRLALEACLSRSMVFALERGRRQSVEARRHLAAALDRLEARQQHLPVVHVVQGRPQEGQQEQRQQEAAHGD
jgi:DNA-binding transcriptional regulator YiaG